MKKETIHYAPEYFIDPTHPITITVIGVGGTGSLVLPRLARLDYVLKELGMPGLYVIAYDGDKVESNNVGRQNFNVNDVGEYKASNLIEKINLTFGLDWSGINLYVQQNNIPSTNIIITCVDNVEIREAVSKLISKKKHSSCNDYNKRFYWLDCGNGKDFGQVILSTFHEIEQPEKSVFNCQGNLPSVIDIYGDLSQFDTKESQGIEGCSMAESLAKQDVFINDEIAIQAVKIVQQLVRHFRIFYHGAVVNQATNKVIGIPIPFKEKQSCQNKKKSKK